MKSVNTLVPVRDILDLLQRIECSEENTISQLLHKVELDLKSDNTPIENLKALNYFMLYASINGSSLNIYETVLKSCLNFFSLISDKHKMHCVLIGSIIDSSFSCISSDRKTELFSYVIDHIVSRLEAFSSCNISLENSDLNHSLLIVEKLCNHVISFDNKCSNLFPKSLDSLILNFMFTLPLELLKKSITTVLPAYAMAQDSNAFLRLMWEKIEQQYKINQQIENHLFFLCLLSDNYIEISSSILAFPLYEKSLFWEILQYGLICDSYMCRKQALYLLKRYISVLEKSDIKFDSELFFWCSTQKSLILLFWSQMFVMFEVLEEKQTHLIMPAFKNFRDIYSVCEINEKICYSWLYCVFHRIINHSSTTLVKWGLREFCLLKTNYLFSDRKSNALLHSFFKALNNMFLYSPNDDSCEGSDLKQNLIKWFSSVSENNDCYSVTSKTPFEIVLQSLVCSAWSPIPLFFVINSLSEVPQTQSLSVSCYSFIQKILSETLKTQSVYIRSAIQCQLLKCILQHPATEDHLDIIINILGQFNAQESLSRGSGMWGKCANWLRIFFDSRNITWLIDLCTKKIFDNQVCTVSIHSVARGIVLFNDAGIFVKNDSLSNLFVSIGEEFVNCEKRIYSSQKLQNKCAEFVKCIINELNISDDRTQNDLLNLVKPCMSNLLMYVEIQLKRGSFCTVEEVDLYEGVVISLLSNASLAAFNELISLYKLAFNVLRSLNSTFLQEFLSLKVIFQCYKCIIINQYNKDKFVVPFNEDIFELIFVNRLLNKDSIHADLDPGSEHNLKGKLMAETMKTLWSIFDIHLKFNSLQIRSILDRLPIPTLINCALSAISEDGKQAIVPILKSFVILLPFNKNVDLSIELIKKSWQACFELRKSELFWFGITEWIAMVFQENIVSVEEYHQVLFSHAKNIMELGDELVGLVDIFVDQLNTFNSPREFSFIICEALTFGGISRKDKRMEYDVCQYIMKKVREGSMESFGNWMQLKNDKEVRLKAMNLLLKPGLFEKRHEIIKCVIVDLLVYDEALSKNTKRYFNDSVTHRKKHRLLQACLILENYIFHHPDPQFKELPAKIFDWTFNSLLASNQQPSVRYQLEWLFILLNIHYPQFFSSFWQLFNKAGEERVGSICSFISIAYHLAYLLKDDNFLEQCIETLIPWCMSQNFNIRLYAQVALSKLWELNTTISERYNFIRINQWKTCEQGNMLANAKKMQSDFYFSTFHPIQHFTMQTLYWDLPRLANISSEEWIHPDILKKYTHFSIDFQGPETVPSLESCSSPNWVSRTTGETEEVNEGGSIQKKFIPWKGMFPDSNEESNRTKSGIIMVASLIDKAANLGGLARTCEIFAAKELVVPSLELTKDKEFIGLSMTAEKHLLITEVRPYNLQEYLKIMKSMGYLLIGAEQTTGSVSLTTYKFPPDCVLVLGSEREGIPANLIPLLDDCVEIPQLGVIRSLNVHVSGALLLWEYSKQHSLQ